MKFPNPKTVFQNAFFVQNTESSKGGEASCVLGYGPASAVAGDRGVQERCEPPLGAQGRELHRA